MTESTMDPSMWRERAQRAEAEVERLSWDNTALLNDVASANEHAGAAEDRLRKVAGKLGRLIECIERECEGSEGSLTCHEYDRTDDGKCALAADLEATAVLAAPPAAPEAAEACPTCDGTGTVTQDIDQHGRRYINQPVEEREHPCDDCDGTGSVTPERKWCAYHHHYEDTAPCTCPKPEPADLPFPAPVSSGEAATGEAGQESARLVAMEQGASRRSQHPWMPPAPVVAPSAEGR